MATDSAALPFHQRSFRPELTAALRQRWLEGPALVVTGVAGVGKTWTVQNAALTMVADGVVSDAWVAHVHGPPQSWGPAIAEQLGEGAPDTPAELAAWLERRSPCLLALDLAVAPPEAVSWVESLAGDAPGCRIALVSRRAFPTWSVPHTEVPPLAPPTGDELDGPAAAYLEDRLRHLGLEADDPGALGAILRWLQGVPLAIDMVVPRLRVMTAPMLLHRLQKARENLSAGTASFDEVVELSWRVLAAPEREALVQLSVASTPISLSTAEALLGAEATPCLERLVDDGWLRASEGQLTLLRAATEVVRRRADDDALAKAETTMVRTLSGRQDPEARRQRSHALSLAAQRPRLGRAQAEAMLLAMRRDDGPWFNDGLAPERVTHGAVIDAILNASRGSGAAPAAWVEAWICRAEHAIVAGDEATAHRALSHAEGVGASLGASQVVAVGITRAELALAMHDGARARGLAGSLRKQATSSGDAHGELRCLAVLARAHEQLDDDRTALALWQRLYAHVRERPAWREAVALRLAWCQLDLGAHAEATGTLDTVESADVSHDVLRAFLAHDAGDWATASERYRALLPTASGRIEAMAWIGWGLLKQKEDDAEAGSAFRQARLAASACQAFDWARLAVALARCADAELPEVARAPLLEVSGGIRGSRADRLAADLREGCEGQGVLGRLAVTPAKSTVRPPEHALVLASNGQWFRPPGEASVSLVNRPTVARVLNALAAHRSSSPGDAMNYEAVLRAAWPGERVRADAGAHRVRVAVSTLRKLGLRAQLQTVRGGYRLDPACPVVTTPE